MTYTQKTQHAEYEHCQTFKMQRFGKGKTGVGTRAF